jgi:hypothetical protein
VVFEEVEHALIPNSGDLLYSEDPRHASVYGNGEKDPYAGWRLRTLQNVDTKGGTRTVITGNANSIRPVGAD